MFNLMDNFRKEKTMDGEIRNGEVVWFNVQRGFGFIKDLDQGDDVFVHYSKINGPEGEFRVLDQGDKVKFERVVVDRGNKAKSQAMNVTVTERSKSQIESAIVIKGAINAASN